VALLAVLGVVVARLRKAAKLKADEEAARKAKADQPAWKVFSDLALAAAGATAAAAAAASDEVLQTDLSGSKEAAATPETKTGLFARMREEAQAKRADEVRELRSTVKAQSDEIAALKAQGMTLAQENADQAKTLAALEKELAIATANPLAGLFYTKPKD